MGNQGTWAGFQGISICFGLLAAIGSGCARINTIHGSTGGATPAPTPTATPPPAPSLADVVDSSVNHSSALTASGVLTVRTESTSASAVGSYVGGGAGNKAIAGFSRFDRLALSSLTQISFEAKDVTGPDNFYLNLIVDLDCVLDEDLSSAAFTIADVRSRRKIIAVDQFTVTALDNGFSRYEVLASDSRWTAVGGAGGLPSSSPGQPLSTFLASYPNACIINGVAADGGMGRATGTGCQTGASLATTAPGYCGEPVSGINFVLGSSGTLNLNEWQVRTITINSTVMQ